MAGTLALGLGFMPGFLPQPDYGEHRKFAIGGHAIYAGEPGRE